MKRTFLRTKYYLLLIAMVLLTTYYLLPTSYAAQLYLYPDNMEVVAGSSFVIEVRLDTEGQSINAIDITGSLEGGGIIESVTTANSMIDIFIDASVTNRNMFRFSGGSPGGFNGNGIVGRLNITATTPGSLSVKFDESSKLLSGTGELLESNTKLRGISINSLQPSENYISITSKSHPDQNKWYDKKDLQLRWNLEDGVDYSYLISLDPTATPDNESDRPGGNIKWQGDVNIEGLEEGIYYFTLKRVNREGIARFRAMIDTTPPEWLGVETSEGVQETNYKAFVSFLAKDELSGISHYEVKVDNGPSELVIAPYILPDDYLKIELTAFDNAGNSTDKSIIGDTQRNIIVIYIVVGLIILGGAIVAIRPIRERIFTKEN